jgi:hypothetical protein
MYVPPTWYTYMEYLHTDLLASSTPDLFRARVGVAEFRGRHCQKVHRLVILRTLGGGKSRTGSTKLIIGLRAPFVDEWTHPWNSIKILLRHSLDYLKPCLGMSGSEVVMRTMEEGEYMESVSRSAITGHVVKSSTKNMKGQILEERL